MKVFLKVIVDYATWIHVIGVIGILFCLRAAFMARRERNLSIYTLEKEAATNTEFRVLTIGMTIAAAMGVVVFLTAVVAPRVTFSELSTVAETPAALILPTVTPSVATPTPTATSTPTRIRPTPLPVVILTEQVPTPVPTPPPPPPPPPPFCPNSLARLTSPGQNAVVSGTVQIMGTADLPNFDYYKIEYAPAGSPTEWALITDLRRSTVKDGLLDSWNTTNFPNGPYLLRLMVVDNTGNYPEPCEVSVVVNN